MFFERTKNKIAPHHMMRVLYLFGTTPDQQCPKLLSSAVVPFGSCSDDRGDLTKTLLITTATSIFGKKDNLCVPKKTVLDSFGSTRRQIFNCNVLEEYSCIPKVINAVACQLTAFCFALAAKYHRRHFGKAETVQSPARFTVNFEIFDFGHVPRLL